MKLPQSISNGPASAPGDLLLAAPPASSVLLPLVIPRAGVARALARQVPGRMLNIPTLKSGRARATRKYRARASPSRVSVLTERQPT